MVRFCISDQTVLSANVAELLDSSLAITSDKIGGVGGQTDVDIFRTQLRFARENDGKVVFRGDFAACYDPEMLDMSVLGRDILDLNAAQAQRSASVETGLQALAEAI